MGIFYRNVGNCLPVNLAACAGEPELCCGGRQRSSGNSETEPRYIKTIIGCVFNERIVESYLQRTDVAIGANDYRVYPGIGA